MNFIEIRPGKNLRKSEIIDVEYIDELSCKLTTAIGIYDCNYPSWRILMLLEQEDIEEKFLTVQPQSSNDRTNLWGAQSWVG